MVPSFAKDGSAFYNRAVQAAAVHAIGHGAAVHGDGGLVHIGRGILAVAAAVEGAHGAAVQGDGGAVEMLIIFAAAKDHRIAARIGDGFGLVCGAQIRYVDATALVRGDGDRGTLGVQDVALEFENGFF